MLHGHLDRRTARRARRLRHDRAELAHGRERRVLHRDHPFAAEAVIGRAERRHGRDGVDPRRDRDEVRRGPGRLDLVDHLAQPRLVRVQARRRVLDRVLERRVVGVRELEIVGRHRARRIDQARAVVGDPAVGFQEVDDVGAGHGQAGVQDVDGDVAAERGRPRHRDQVRRLVQVLDVEPVGRRRGLDQAAGQGRRADHARAPGLERALVGEQAGRRQVYDGTGVDQAAGLVGQGVEARARRHDRTRDGPGVGDRVIARVAVDDHAGDAAGRAERARRGHRVVGPAQDLERVARPQAAGDGDVGDAHRDVGGPRAAGALDEQGGGILARRGDRGVDRQADRAARARPAVAARIGGIRPEERLVGARAEQARRRRRPTGR